MFFNSFANNDNNRNDLYDDPAEFVKKLRSQKIKKLLIWALALFIIGTFFLVLDIDAPRELESITEYSFGGQGKKHVSYNYSGGTYKEFIGIIFYGLSVILIILAGKIKQKT